MGNPPSVTVHAGDCLDVLKTLPDHSVDAVVTDPPAGISFMGKDWDKDKGGRDAWVSWLTAVMTEVRRVLKPGGHALVWALPRTSHWTATALEDAGLEIRDCIVHLFGSGFPKSLDIGKAIDKRPGVRLHREFAAHLTERRETAGLSRSDVSERVVGSRSGACWNWEHHQFPEARWWPSLRDLLNLDPKWGDVIAEAEREVIGARKMNRLVIAPGQGEDRPSVALSETTPATDDAKRWDGWGTALKPGQEHWWLVRKPLEGTVAANVLAHGVGGLNVDGCRVGSGGQLKWVRPRDMGYHGGTDSGPVEALGNPAGRWPANLALTHSADCPEDGPCAGDCPVAELDVTSRYFPTFRYQAKAPARERPRLPDGTAWPTVKPLGLMRWLVRLITPPGGIVLDPFGGTGTTAEACALEGFRCVLIESDPTALELTRVRLERLAG